MTDSAHYLNRPVFISGFHKSGTTLLLSLLDGHPQLVVFPEELHFFRKVLLERDKAKALREKSGFKMFLPGWDNHQWSQGVANFREGYPEFDCIKFNQRVEQALQFYKSDKDLLLLLIKAFAEVDYIDPASKIHWVSKTPRDEMFFPLMLKMFGKDFKLLYLVRDPRDVYLSFSKRRKMEGVQEDLITFSVYWQTQINRVVHYQKKHENIVILRFEDLLMNTENVLIRLCKFLQIDYSKELLQTTRHGKLWGGNSVFSEGFKGVSKEPIGRFREFLHPESRILLEHFLSRELALLGYESHSAAAVKAGNIRIPWLEYWMASLRYRRWYFLKQYSTTFRYSISQLYGTRLPPIEGMV